MCHFDRREKSYVFSKLYFTDFSLAQTGFLYSTVYYPHVAPLAQTGMTGTDINAKAVAPGRAGRALSAVVAEAASASAIGYGRRRMAKSACSK